MQTPTVQFGSIANERQVGGKSVLPVGPSAAAKQISRFDVEPFDWFAFVRVCVRVVICLHND